LRSQAAASLETEQEDLNLTESDFREVHRKVMTIEELEALEAKMQAALEAERQRKAIEAPSGVEKK
jgi:hypothetical protein